MVEADLAREYGISAEQLAEVSTRRFLVLVSGLPSKAGFPRAWARTPRVVTSPREIAALTRASISRHASGEPIADNRNP